MSQNKISINESYAVLGIKPGATRDEVKSAFRKMAKEVHPDIVQDDPDAARRFDRLQQAYRALEEYLSGKSKKDQSGHVPEPGIDLYADIFVPLEMVVFGGEMEVPVPEANKCRVCNGIGSPVGARVDCTECYGSGTSTLAKGIVRTRIQCPTCHGVGSVPSMACSACKGSGKDPQGSPIKVVVPVGFSEGDVIRIKGAGAAGEFPAPAGDMLVTLRTASHQRFKRSGDDLLTQKTLSFADLCLGSSFQIAKLDGGQLSVDVPAGTQAGVVLSVPKAGLPDRDGYRGNLLIKIQPRIPKQLNHEQAKAVERLKDLGV